MEQWTYFGDEVSDERISGFEGFVYEIINLVDGRRYIGKKNFHKTKQYQKDKKKKRKRVESDWRKYFGSSEELKADVATHGKDKFQRVILRFCRTKSEMNYYELRYQMVNDVLLKPEKYYNGYVGTRIARKQLRLKDYDL